MRLYAGSSKQFINDAIQNQIVDKLKLAFFENVRYNPSLYVLIDEQFVVFDNVLACAKAGLHDRRKQVMIIHAGPGMGKSVIALNLMAELLDGGYNAHYATGSKAFTETLRKIIGTRGAVQFKFFNNYMNADLNDVDVLICDEAHRIRETSNNRFTKKQRGPIFPKLRNWSGHPKSTYSLSMIIKSYGPTRLVRRNTFEITRQVWRAMYQNLSSKLSSVAVAPKLS